MNTTLFWRLVWKEYRQQRALMITLAASLLITAYCQLGPGRENRDINSMLVGFMFVIPFVYALGCGCTLFAGERENETLTWLRSLPHDGREAFWAKVSLATVSTSMMVIGLFCLARVENTAFTRSDEYSLHPSVFSEMILEVLLWSILCSLWMRHVFTAVVVAGIAISCSSVLMAILGTYNPLSFEFDEATILVLRGISMAS